MKPMQIVSPNFGHIRIRLTCCSGICLVSCLVGKWMYANRTRIRALPNSKKFVRPTRWLFPTTWARYWCDWVFLFSFYRFTMFYLPHFQPILHFQQKSWKYCWSVSRALPDKSITRALRKQMILVQGNFSFESVTRANRFFYPSHVLKPHFWEVPLLQYR